MKSNLIKALAPIMCLSKMLGLNRFSCRVNSDSILYFSSSMWCTLMDITQMIVYLTCTYIVLRQPVFFFRYVNLIRYWTILALVRFKEERIIRFINGIVAFDRKWSTLPAATRRTAAAATGPRFWSLLVTAYLAYYTWFVVYTRAHATPNYNAGHLAEVVFTVPRVADFSVAVACCFHLDGLASRFAALNAFWERSQAQTSAAVARTAQESAVLAECVRLLHADLSDLLRSFGRAYGPVLVAFFGAVLLDMASHCFVMLFATEIRLAAWPSVALEAQNVVSMVAVMGCATRVTDQKKRIILLLRHNSIANISKDIQIQFFMNQVSSYEMSETLAYGLFDYNLKFCIPIIVMLIKINSTMIQMEGHPYLKKIINDMMNNRPWNE